MPLAPRNSQYRIEWNDPPSDPLALGLLNREGRYFLDHNDVVVGRRLVINMALPNHAQVSYLGTVLPAIDPLTPRRESRSYSYGTLTQGQRDQLTATARSMLDQVRISGTRGTGAVSNAQSLTATEIMLRRADLSPLRDYVSRLAWNIEFGEMTSLLDSSVDPRTETSGNPNRQWFDESTESTRDSTSWLYPPTDAITTRASTNSLTGGITMPTVDNAIDHITRYNDRYVAADMNEVPFVGGMAHPRPGFALDNANERVYHTVYHTASGERFGLDPTGSHHRGRSPDDMVTFAIGRILCGSSSLILRYPDDFRGYEVAANVSYPETLPQLNFIQLTNASAGDTTMPAQLNITGALQQLINKFKPLERDFKRGQLAWIDVERHGGVTDVPKNGCFVYIKKVHTGYSDVVYLGRGGIEAYWGRNTGAVFSASHRVMKRFDVARMIEIGNMGAFTYAELSSEDQAMYERFAYWCRVASQPNNVIERCMEAITVNASRKLAERIAGWEQVRDQYRTTCLIKDFNLTPSTLKLMLAQNGVKETLKRVGSRIAGYIKEVNLVTDDSGAAALANKLMEKRSGVTTRFRYTSDIERREIGKMVESLYSNFSIHRSGCSHYVAQGEEISIDGWGRYCPSCHAINVAQYGEPVDAINRDGYTVRVFPAAVYMWEDGTRRTYEPPPVIGNYHSNKLTFTKSLPHVTGKMPHKSVLKVGYELEFCRDQPKQRDEDYARQMLKRIDTALHPVIGTQPYCGFERDGSVDFEMVSGYGPIDIHRAGVVALLQGNPWGKELQSHNGGRCGLHVHLDKPTSVMHATRLASFWNNPFNEKLIKAVARRYGKGIGYAKFKPQVGDMLKSARDYSNTKRNGYDKKRCVSRAITNLSSERYDVCNFTNERTVEIRAFRGSMVVDTVIACLEFAYMSWYFARDTEADKLTTEKFLDYISKTEWRHETRYIRKYLWGKGFKVWMSKRQPRKSLAEV